MVDQGQKKPKKTGRVDKPLPLRIDAPNSRKWQGIRNTASPRMTGWGAAMEKILLMKPHSKTREKEQFEKLSAGKEIQEVGPGGRRADHR